MKREPFDGLRAIAIAGLMLALTIILWPPTQRKGNEHDNTVHSDSTGPDTRLQDEPTSRRAAEGQVGPASETLPHDEGRAGHLDLYTVTAYCPCRKCCGAYADGYTASGASVSANGGFFVAADRSIPFGTMVAVPGYAGGRPVPVLDRGAAIGKGRLDLFFPTHSAAMNWGRQTLTVEIQR